MTLKDVREPARLITDWCLAQDDLVGFHIEVKETGHSAWIQVSLDWPDGRYKARSFGLRELELLREPQAIVDILDRMATQARRQDLPVAD